MKKSLILASLLLASSSVMATNIDNTYMGMNYNKIDFNSGVTNTTGTSNLDEKDNGYKLYLGYNYTKNIAVEVHYADFGEASLSGNNGDRFDLGGTTYEFNQTANITIGSKSLGIATVGKTKLTNNIDVFAKIGLHRAKEEANIAATTVSDSTSETKTKLFYSAGLSYPITSQLSATAEYQIYKFNDGDIKGFSVGLNYKF